jgi:hypothetical protein
VTDQITRSSRYPKTVEQWHSNVFQRNNRVEWN